MFTRSKKEADLSEVEPGSSSHIKFIHEYFEELSLEAEHNLLDPSSYKPSQLEIKNLNKNYEIFKPRGWGNQEAWTWLQEATKCFHIHLRNAALYHQFKQNLKDLTNEIENIKERCIKMKNNEDVSAVSEITRNLLEKLLKLQSEVDQLHDSSHRVIPIHLRRLPCQPSHAQPIVSIGSYYDINGKLIEENSPFYLLDNSDASKWKVRSDTRHETIAPSLLFIVPPPDASLMQDAYKLRWHLLSVWKFCVDEAKRNLRGMLVMQLDEGKNYELQQLASTHKKKILEILDAAKNLLNGENHMHEDTSLVNNKIHKYAENLAKHQSSYARGNTGLSKEWMEHQDLTENIKEMDVYMKNYAGNVTSQACSKHHLVTNGDTNNKPQFKSCAYIQRWPEEKVTPTVPKSKLMMIYEVGNSPSFTSNLRGEVKEVVEERVVEDVEETQFTSQTIKETEKFFIRGVFDPRTGKVISSQQAINNGIIDLKRGHYRNPMSREDILIQEAMERGLIMVEYSNKSVEMGELIKSGIFKTITKKEVISYVILSIKDPRTGRNISVSDALKSGLIDQEQGRFILNKDSGDAISIESAIKKGFLEVKELNRHPIIKEEPSNVKVNGVYDIVGKHFIPLQQALRRDVVDRNSAALRNKATGEVIPLKEAVRRGLVLLEISPGSDSNSLKNFPVLKQEDFDEIMESVADGYSADPILELMTDVSDESLFYDPSNREQMSLKRAMISNRVGFDPLMVTLEDGTKLLLHEALLSGILDLRGVNELLKVVGGKRSLLKLVEDERLDLNTGEFVDLATKNRKTLKDAAENKLINPSLLFYWDDQSHVATSLKASLDNDRLKNGKVFDFENNNWLTMEEAVKKGLIGLEVNSNDLLEKYSAMMLFKDLIEKDGNERGGLKVNGLPLADAIMKGELDVGGLQLLMPGEGFIPLSAAVERNLMKPKAAEEIINVAHKNDLNNFFVSHKTFDPSTGRMTHPSTGRKITFMQATSEGLVDPNSVFVVDCADGGIKSMKRLATEGKFNLETGRVKDINTGRERSLMDAIKNGLVKPDFDPVAYLEQSNTVESIIKSDPKNKYIELKNGERISLDDAIAKGFVDPSTKVKLNGRNGELLFVDDIDGDVLARLKKVSTLENLLDQFRDDFDELKKSNKTERNDLESFRNKLKEFKTDFVEVFGKFDEINSSSDPNKFNKLKHAANKLHNNLQKLEDGLEEEITKQMLIKEKISQALEDLMGLKEVFNDLEDEFKLLNLEASNSNIDLNEVIHHAQDMDSRLQSKLEELLSIKSHCNDLMEDHQVDPDRRGAHVGNAGPTQIKKTIKVLNDSFNKLNFDLPKFLTNLSMASKNQDRFTELEELFLNKLVAVENSISNVNKSENMNHDEKVAALNELSDLESALVELTGTRNDLEQLGSEVDMSFKKIRRPNNNRVMGANDLEQMKQEVANMQDQLNRTMSEIEKRKHHLQQIRDEIGNIEKTVNSERPSLDRRKLMQVGDQLLQGGRTIETIKRELLEAMTEDLEDEDLVDRLERIGDKIQSKQKKIAELSSSLKEFNEIKDSLNTWMKGFIARVNATDDARVFRVKIKKLNDEKTQKEAELRRLNDVGTSLMIMNEVTEKNVVHGDLRESNKKWEDVTKLLTEYVIHGAVAEIDKLLKYIEEMETKMNNFEPITIKRDQLVEQLKSHQKFHNDLRSKKAGLVEVVRDYSWWLNHSLDERADDVKMKLEALMERLSGVSQSSMSRLICLEDATIMATHFDESLSDLKSWLNEVEADVVSMETAINKNNSIEQYNKFQEHAKTTCHEISDRFEPMEVLKGTGLELKELCGEREAKFIDDQVSQLTRQYERIKEGNRKCLHDLQDAVHNSNDEAFNLLMNIHNDLEFYNHHFLLAFQPSLTPAVLFQQISDLQSMHDDILKVTHVISQVQQEMTPNNSLEEMQLMESLIEKEKDLEVKVISKRQDLENVLKFVEEFESIYTGIMSSLQNIQDNLSSQDHPGVEMNIVSDQINEIHVMEEDLHNVREMFKACDELVDRICETCDAGITVELRKLQDNRDHIFGNVLEGLSVRKLDLNAASDLSQKYAHHLGNVADWLPRAEERMSKIMKTWSGRSSNPSDVDKQLCNLKRDLMASYDDVIKLKDVLSSFKVISPLSTKVLLFEVNDIEGRFNSIILTINESLLDKDIDHLDLIQNLIQSFSADQLNTKEQFWNSRLLKKELNLLQGEHFANFPDDVVTSQQLLCTCIEWQDKAAQLRDKEQQVEDLLKWIEDFKSDLIFLRALRSQSALLKSQAQHFEKRNKEFEEKAEEAEKVVDEIKTMDGRLEVDYLVNMLQESINNSGDISMETERRLKEHLEDVETFHSLIGEHSKCMSDIEMTMSQQQIISSSNIQELERNLVTERAKLQDILKHGSALKFFGRKQDSVAINSSLLNAQLRWNRTFRRMKEVRNKSSEDQNQKEKFRQQHSDLMKTFEEVERKVNDKNLLKDLMILEDEIAAGEKKLHALNHTLRNMKAGAADNDLHALVLELKKKWNNVHNSLINKKNKLDLDLITSGKLTEAIKVQCNWLLKCLDYLDENQPLLGDLDTVSMLIDQYKNFQQDLRMHESLVESIRSSNPPPGSIDQLNSLWNEVIRLNDIRRDKLHEAHGLAAEFQEAVEKVRRILPEIEEGLRETGVNIQSEEQLMSLIDHHQKLHTKLCDEQPTMERISFMSDEIMENCHPSATRFMQYYLTITQKRWEQDLMKSNNALERLNENLKKYQGGATVVDDLWMWLSEAQQLLATKSEDHTPHDLATVDALIRDHQDFHEDLINKNDEIDGVIRDAQLSKTQIQTLQNKWRSVWRLSVERKKMLQETLEHLLEMESLNNFNFGEWKQRYNSWIKKKMLRVTDFFRKQDTQGYGTLSRNQFVDGMINSKFPSNKMELNAIFDLFEDPASGEMNYKNLIEALKSERMGQKSARVVNPSKFVDDEVVTQLSRCQCRKQFAAYKMEEGKYQFGEKGKTHLLRFVNGVVMVRVGGGWVSLTEFLQSNDPCRAKNRTNIEIYKTLQDRIKSTSSLNKSISGSVTSLNVNQSRNETTPKRSRTPQTTNLMKRKDASLNHSMTSLISIKSKDSDIQNVNKSSDSLKTKPSQKTSFVPPKQASTPKSESKAFSGSRELRKTSVNRPTGQR